MDSFETQCAALRDDLKAFYPRLKALIVSAQEETPAAVADGETATEAQEEMAANATLALRHLEDCSMRVGKAIQAYNGGKSPFDGTLGALATPAATDHDEVPGDADTKNPGASEDAGQTGDSSQESQDEQKS